MNFKSSLSSKILLRLSSIFLLIWAGSVFLALRQVHYPAILETFVGIIGPIGFLCLLFGLITWLFETKDNQLTKKLSPPNHKRNLIYFVLAIPAILLLTYIIFAASSLR